MGKTVRECAEGLLSGMIQFVSLIITLLKKGNKNITPYPKLLPLPRGNRIVCLSLSQQITTERLTNFYERWRVLSCLE